jgi:hypothetical protein
LRISGSELDIDAMLVKSSLSPLVKWKKGEGRSAKGRTHASSGANFSLSEAEIGNFKQQISDATNFLASNSAAIRQLAMFPGVEDAALDFGASISEESAAVFCNLPASLVALAADARIALEISVYKNTDDPPEK